jgi:hypothetical protein
VSAQGAPRAQQGRARPHLGNESCLDSQNGITARRWFWRWGMKKRKMAAHGHCGKSSQRDDRRYHRNRETIRPCRLRLGKNSVCWSLSFAAGMTGRHHGASTLLRHVMAALAFRGSHGRNRKDARHGRRDRPEQGNRQQREGSDSSHSHDCTAFTDYDRQVLLPTTMLVRPGRQPL